MLQASVDAEHHLIVVHEVINEGHDRSQLTPTASPPGDSDGRSEVLADRGYFGGEEIMKRPSRPA